MSANVKSNVILIADTSGQCNKIAAQDVGLYVNMGKTEFISFNQ